MFPWKDFLMARIRKIQKNKKQRMEQRKRRDFYMRGGSHTRVFSISQERPYATLPQENPLVREPPLQHELGVLIHLFSVT
jgi:hypothetical protein